MHVKQSHDNNLDQLRSTRSVAIKKLYLSVRLPNVVYRKGCYKILKWGDKDNKVPVHWNWSHRFFVSRQFKNYRLGNCTCWNFALSGRVSSGIV